MHVFLVRYCDELCIASIHAVRKKTAYLFDKVNLWPNTWFSIWKPVIYRILYKNILIRTAYFMLEAGICR
jgi:hypothetical protein